MVSIVDEVMALVARTPRDPEAPAPQGTMDAVIDGLGTRIGLPIPDELREWLRRCNCGMIGPGGMYGICSDDPSMDIEAKYRLYPHWRDKGWIPVASDGCGDYYVLDTTVSTRTGHPILFLDHELAVEKGCDTATYVVASGLWPFLRYILLDELDEAHNLFNEREALREDPGLADDVGVPRPWEE